MKFLQLGAECRNREGVHRNDVFQQLRQEDGTGGNVDSNAALSAGSAAANLNLRERSRQMSTDFVGSAGYVIGLWGSSMMAQARDSKASGHHWPFAGRRLSFNSARNCFAACSCPEGTHVAKGFAASACPTRISSRP